MGSLKAAAEPWFHLGTPPAEGFKFLGLFVKKPIVSNHRRTALNVVAKELACLCDGGAPPTRYQSITAAHLGQQHVACEKEEKPLAAQVENHSVTRFHVYLLKSFCQDF